MWEETTEAAIQMKLKTDSPKGGPWPWSSGMINDGVDETQYVPSTTKGVTINTL
jgi:hypothetical protein